MTQFLLLQAPLTFPAEHKDLSFSRVAEIGSPLTDAAQALFPSKAEPVWKVAPHAEEADALAEEAREVLLLRGGQLEHDAWASTAGRNESEVLLRSDDFVDLPEPGTRGELFALLERQLRTDGSSNYELYAQWLSDA